MLQSVFEQDYVTVAPVRDTSAVQFVGKDLKSSIAELEKRMRAAAADLEFEEAARLRDESVGWKRSISASSRRRRRARQRVWDGRPNPSATARRSRWVPAGRLRSLEAPRSTGETGLTQ